MSAQPSQCRRRWPVRRFATGLSSLIALAIACFLVLPRGKGAIPERSPASRISEVSIVVPVAPAKAVADTKEAKRIASVDSGRELFLREWMPDDPRSHGGDGLGPVFNDSSCVACHNLGGAGGAGPNSKNVDILSTQHASPKGQQQRGREAGKPVQDDDPARIHPGFANAASVVLHRFGNAPEYALWRLERLGRQDGSAGSVVPRNVENGPPEVLAKLEIEHSRMSSGPRNDPQNGPRRRSFDPGEAGLTRSQRNPTPLFGVGAIDAIPDEVLKEAARKTFADFPEITGRVASRPDGRIGRFGWKAQMPSLGEFVVTACSVELGLEAPGQPQGSDPTDSHASDVKAPGLDLTTDECDALVAFVRSLPAPRQQDSRSDAESETIQGGKKLFVSIGCGTCHTPNLGQVEGIYSDLLLHDMGPETSDTSSSYRMFRPESSSPDRSPGSPVEPPAAVAAPGEWRTPPLWGLRDSGPYLHDGRAETLDQAIALHGAEGKDPANRYFGLSPRRRHQVQAFLKSLVAPLSSPSS